MRAHLTGSRLSDVVAGVSGGQGDETLNKFFHGLLALLLYYSLEWASDVGIAVIARHWEE